MMIWTIIALLVLYMAIGWIFAISFAFYIDFKSFITVAMWWPYLMFKGRKNDR